MKPAQAPSHDVRLSLGVPFGDLPRHRLDAQLKPRTRIRRHQSRRVFKEIILPVPIGIPRRPGLRIIQPKISHLPVIPQPVPSVTPKIIRNTLHHRQPHAPTEPPITRLPCR